MRVVLFGGTGMIGQGVLLECFDDPAVTEVLSIVRRPSGKAHDKLREIRHDDFSDYSAIAERLTGYDACFFCLGVSAAGMSEAEYQRVTYDFTLAAAQDLVERNPAMTFCYVSGSGADSSEKGRIMWARVKGRIENALLALPFRAVYLFRPGLIQPLRGIKSRTRLYRFVYVAIGPLFPLLDRFLPAHVTTTERVGVAMIRVARGGYKERYLENRDINAVAA